jgi:hypothetical protein
MNGSANYMIGSIAAFLFALGAVACTVSQEPPKPVWLNNRCQPPRRTEEAESTKGDESGQNKARGGRCHQRKPADYHLR